MKLQVSEIKERSVNLQLQEPAANFPVLAEMEKSGEVVFLTPVVVTLHAYSVGGMVELSGHVSVQIELPCGRCLVASPFELSSDFSQSYVEELPHVSGEDGQELELSAEEMGLELFEDDCIDLTEEIQQQLLLMFPDHPLCSESCKGLCAVCGTDLNLGQCCCDSRTTSLQFAALKDFKVEK